METVQRIPEFENYHVSTAGVVYNINNPSSNSLKHMITRKGYHMVALYSSGKRNWRSVARLVAMVFIPNPENKPQVNHIDGDKDNNHDWNLEWMTNLENQQHARRTGLKVHNLNAGRKKIKVKVYNYKTNKYLSTHESATAAANFYGVSRGNVGQIIKGNRQQTKGLTFKKLN
jgi:hypothetical protein